MATKYDTQLLNIIEDYAREHGVEEVDLDAVSEWAISKGRYQRPTITMQKQCRKEMADAMRKAKYVDPQGRADVRTKHAVKIKIKGEQKPLIVWVDIRTAKPNTMRESLRQGRKSMGKGAIKHNTYLESYNDNNIFGANIPPFDYNLNVDVAEGNLSDEYNEYDDEYNENENED